MDNSTEDLSSTANHSSGAGNASEESGWTPYIDYFMETQRRQEHASGAVAPSTDEVGSCSSTSHYGGDCAVGGSSWLLPALVEPSEASPRKLSLKRESRRKKVMYDESLEDTATSPIISPELIELRESDANHQKKEEALDEFSLYKKTADAAELAGYNNLTNNGTNTRTDMVGDDDSTYDNNGLRKKGLCLVDVSDFNV